MKRCVVAWTIWAGGVDHERSYVRERWRLVACGSPASTILGKRSPLPKAKVSSDTDRCQYPYLRACELVRSARSRRRLIGRKRLDGRNTTNSRGRRQSLAGLAQCHTAAKWTSSSYPGHRLRPTHEPPYACLPAPNVTVQMVVLTACNLSNNICRGRRTSPRRIDRSRQSSTAVAAQDRI